MKRKQIILLVAAALTAAGVFFLLSRSGQPALRAIQGVLGRRSLTAGSPYNVLTGGYDNGRTNAYTAETVLTPAAVKPGSFGKLFSLAVDGQIYAQPLYAQNVDIASRGTHNVVFAVTMHNTVYAFDADAPGIPLWTVNLGPSVPTSKYSSPIEGDYTDIMPENGILGTPVIDAASATMYVVAATFEGGKYFYRLHALDVSSGAEKFNGPSVIAGQVNGTGDGSANGVLAFDPLQHLQRPALLLVNGNVYIAFGSHGDGDPFHGWIMGYNAQDVSKQVSVFTPTPNGGGGAFWQSGRGLSADDAGNIYAVSSNGDTDMTANFADNVLRLDSTATKIADWFSPSNVQDLNDTDDDLGTTGAVLIPGTNYLATAGKQGVIYLMDRSNLGHSSANDTQLSSRIDTGNFLIFNMAIWNRADGPVLYTHTANAGVTAFRIQNGKLSSSPIATSANGFPVPYQGMTLSSNGGQAGSGMLWVLAPTGSPQSPGVLHAYNADDLTETWNSRMADSDAVGSFAKFANPTVDNGRVYVPTGSGQLVVYGVTGKTDSGGATPSTAFVSAIVNGASYADTPLAPGEIVSIMGAGLGPVETAAGAPDANGILAAQLGGTQVTFNGIPGPLLSAADGMVTAIVPYEIATASSVDVVVSYNGKSAPKQTLPVAAVAPGVYSADGSGSGPGAITNEDSTANSPDNPAAPGSSIMLSATGCGVTNPASATGSVTRVAAKCAADVAVTVDGQPAIVSYAGNSMGQVAGSMQINLKLPDGVTGTVPVMLTVGRQTSQATVTVSIQDAAVVPRATAKARRR